MPNLTNNLPMASKPWPKYPSIYEINTRVWLAELSERAGHPLTLDQVPLEEIERIAQYGFHAVWLMGVWTTGEKPTEIARTHPELQTEYRAALPDFKTEDVVGSPYAISAYCVSPRLGGPDALAALREKFARYGMNLILDFVCNHTACDHSMVNSVPDVFIQGREEDIAREPGYYFRNDSGRIIAHGRDPYFPAWTDTAQINYAQPEGRNAMIGELLSIARQCDGVRCDMAMLILPSVMEQVWGPRLGANPNRENFWVEAIILVRQQNANFLFLAESYWNMEWQIQQSGFDFTYDKTLYDRLLRGDFNGVRQHLWADRVFQNHCARFIENHDESRAAAVFGHARSRSAANVTFFSGGLRLFHEGQLEGRRKKVPVQLGRRPIESEHVETAVYYDKLLAMLNNSVFQSGSVMQRQVNSVNPGDNSSGFLIAFWWTPDPGRTGGTSALYRAVTEESRLRLIGYLIVANFNGGTGYGRIPLPGESFSVDKHYVFNDRYDGKRYERNGPELIDPGLYVALESHHSHWFEVYSR